MQAKPVRLILILSGLVLVALGILIAGSSWFDNLLLSVISTWKGSSTALHWSSSLPTLGVEAAIIGLLIAAFGIWALPHWDRLCAVAQAPYFLPSLAMLVLVMLWLPIVLWGRSAVLAGTRYWWLDDDEMISMRYARNLAQGAGLVWNPGVRVEGYSNFLWTLFMAGVHLLPIPVAKTSLVVLLVNLGLSTAALPVLARLVRLLGGNTLTTAATLAAFVLNKNVMVWDTTGVETAWLTLLFVWSVYRVLREAQSDRPRLSTFVLTALLSLVRADALILAGLTYALALALNANRKQVAKYVGLSLLLPLGHELFRIAYYGDVLPNTAYLKVMNWDGRVVAGLAYVWDFARQYGLILLLALAGVISARERWRTLLLVLAGLYGGYVAYVGGDAFPNFRFFLPILPLFLALAFAAAQHLVARPAVQFAIIAAGLMTTPLIVPSYFANLTPGSINVDNVRIGLLLKQNAPPAAKAADFAAGSVFYFSEGEAIDLLGKSDRYIARLPALPQAGSRPGHNKFDFDYSLGVLKPDFVVAAFHWPVAADVLRNYTTGDNAFIGQLYFNPTFQRHCLPNPIETQTLRTIFVCDWSPELPKKNAWTDLP